MYHDLEFVACLYRVVRQLGWNRYLTFCRVYSVLQQATHRFVACLYRVVRQLGWNRYLYPSVNMLAAHALLFCRCREAKKLTRAHLCLVILRLQRHLHEMSLNSTTVLQQPIRHSPQFKSRSGYSYCCLRMLKFTCILFLCQFNSHSSG